MDEELNGPNAAERAWVRIFSTPFDVARAECRWWEYGYTEAAMTEVGD